MTEASTEHPAIAWARSELSALGAEVVELRLVKARAWSTVWVLETSAGRRYLKACGPGFEQEAHLLPAIAAKTPDMVPAVLAVARHAPWLLLADAGATLLTRLDADRSAGLASLSAALQRYATWQLNMAKPDAASLRAMAHDLRPARLAERLADVLSDDELLRLGAVEPIKADAAQVAMVRCRAAVALLSRYGLPDTIDHGDLHANNIGLAGRTVRIIDWGDAAVGHPFASLGPTLDSALAWTEPERRALIAAYLAPWRAAFPDVDCEAALDAALSLRPAYAILLWARGAHAMTGDNRRMAAGHVVAWLQRMAV
jgi:hypothetical protein